MLYFRQWSTDIQQLTYIMNHGQLPTQIMTEKPMQLYSSWDCELEVYVTYNEHIHYFNNILSLKGHKVAVLINWLL